MKLFARRKHSLSSNDVGNSSYCCRRRRRRNAGSGWGREGMRGLYESLNCEGGSGAMNCVEGLPFTGDVVAVLWTGYRIPVLFSLAPLDRAEKDAAVIL